MKTCRTRKFENQGCAKDMKTCRTRTFENQGCAKHMKTCRTRTFENQGCAKDMKTCRTRTFENQGCAKDMKTYANKLEISEWRKKDKNYFETQVTHHMIKAIEVGEPGLEKSSAIHHIALLLEKEQNYRILSCKSSSDIEKFRSDQKQVFVFDDICGKYSVFQNEVESFVKRSDDFRRILKESDSKILISSRLQIF
ncbi:unnamed protein product [Mytilus coruscus]|uniref:Novel STAND NTPase 3 domain-containing protein n=1 Tax=Mytilus coruscus TaxID=42192 RepID=A0A6J8A887_MYTCO|nr:unnamed protein product [Mytilus coruscus]